MPNIANLVLTIQHGGAASLPSSPRTARVRFTTNFTSTEVLAGAVFKAEVKIISDDNDRNRLIGIVYVQATSTGITSNLTQVLTRNNFDEDVDIFMPHNGGIELRENKDEWKARVTLSPVVFETVVANSPLIVGSWGIEGAD